MTETKQTLKTPIGVNQILDNLADKDKQIRELEGTIWRPNLTKADLGFEKDSKLTKITGVLTSSIRPKPSSDTPYYAYLRPDNTKEKHSLAECIKQKCQECEIPVVFRIEVIRQKPFYPIDYVKPSLKKGDKVLLKGEFSPSKKSSRPSFTRYAYEIINDHGKH